MINRIKSIVALIKREIKLITNDIDLTTILLVAPLFYSFFYAATYIYKTEEKIPIAILDFDKSVTSKSIINDINFCNTFSINSYLLNYSDIDKVLLSEDVQGVVVFPVNFEKDLKSYKAVHIKCFLNTHRFMHSNDLNKSLNEIVLGHNNRLRIEFFNSKGLNTASAQISANPIKEEVNFLFNPGEAYGNFIIPALLLLVLQQTLLIGLAESMAKEREDSQIKNIYSLADNKTTTLFIGKSTFYLFLYLSYAVFFLTVHFKVFSIEIGSGFSLLLLSSLLFILAIIPMGLFLGSFFNRKIVALQVVAFTSYPFFFLTGYAYPHYAMPDFLVSLSKVLPGTPFFDIINKTVFMNASFSDISASLYHLIILIVTFSIIAYFRLKAMKPPQSTSIK